jgi:hypothetical protein
VEVIMLGQYRQQMRQFDGEVWEDRYRVSRSQNSRGAPSIFGEYRDLFTREATLAFRAKLKETLQERERHASSKLLAFSIEGRLTHRELELTGELARILREGGDASADQAEDLARERLTQLTAMAQEEGGNDYAHLRLSLRSIDYPGLLAPAQEIFESTSRLLRDAQGALPLAANGQVTSDDRDDFSGGRRLERYQEVMGGMGVRTWQQSALTFHPRDLPFDSSPEEIGCYPIRVPEEIRVDLPEGNGEARERLFWRAVGAAQAAAWTSPHLPPEDQLVTPWGDRALELTWGGLFESLVGDPSWQVEVGRVGDRSLARRQSVLRRLLRLRRASAAFLFSYAALTGGPLERPLTLYLDATDRRPHPDSPLPSYLREVSLTLIPADLLRAIAFETLLRDRLRSVYGRHWWSSRRAGDFLIDLWNTGHRYSPEQMASLAGLGQLDFAWMLDELAADLREVHSASGPV